MFGEGCRFIYEALGAKSEPSQAACLDCIAIALHWSLSPVDVHGSRAVVVLVVKGGVGG